MIYNWYTESQLSIKKEILKNVHKYFMFEHFFFFFEIPNYL